MINYKNILRHDVWHFPLVVQNPDTRTRKENPWPERQSLSIADSCETAAEHCPKMTLPCEYFAISNSSSECDDKASPKWPTVCLLPKYSKAVWLKWTFLFN